MSIGLIGVLSSLVIGVVMGSLSGYYGGWVDLVIQRIIEVISAMPTIPLWLGFAAAVPVIWSPLQVHFTITLIVSLLAWTGLARETRGRFLAPRNEDFVTAARLDGSSEKRVIFRHILPSLTSHILAVATLAIPTMIVAETALPSLASGSSLLSSPRACCCRRPPILRLTDTGSARGFANRCWAWFTMENRGGFLRERLFNRDRTFRAMTCVAQCAGARMRIRRGGFLPLR